MRLTSLCLSAFATLSFSSAAFAEPIQVNNDVTRFFIDASIGSMEHTIGIDGYSGDSEEKETGISIRAGYSLSENVEVAVGYVDFGEATHSDLSASFGGFDYTSVTEGSALTVSGILTSPRRNSPWRFAVELGLANWDYTWRQDYSNGFISGSDDIADGSGVDIFGGITIAYQVISNLEVTFDAFWFTMDPELTDAGRFAFGSDDIDAQVSKYALGLGYQF